MTLLRPTEALAQRRKVAASVDGIGEHLITSDDGSPAVSAIEGRGTCGRPGRRLVFRARPPLWCGSLGRRRWHRGRGKLSNVGVFDAGFKIWETFFRKAAFKPSMAWTVYPDDRALEISIANDGKARDSIAGLVFRYPRTPGSSIDEGALDWEVTGPTLPQLPIFLDVKQVAPRMVFPMDRLRAMGMDNLVDQIEKGSAYLVIEDAGGKETVASIPAPGTGTAPPTHKEIGL
jgi:hypothetical protein